MYHQNILAGVGNLSKSETNKSNANMKFPNFSIQNTIQALDDACLDQGPQYVGGTPYLCEPCYVNFTF